MVPAITPVHAAGNVPPVLTVTNNQYQQGDALGHEVDINITNPSSNQFGIQKVNITAPNLWSFDPSGLCAGYALPGNTGNKYFTTAQCAVAASGLTVQWNTVGSYTLPPGGSQDLGVDVFFPSYSTNGAICGTFTSEVWDTASGHYAANTFQLCNFSTAVTLGIHTSGGLTPSFIAGSPALKVWATIGVHEAGVGVFFQVVNPESGCGTYPYQYFDLCNTGHAGTFSGAGITTLDKFLVEAWTNSSGIALVNYAPLNVAPSAIRLTAYVGGGPTCQGYWTNAESPFFGFFGCGTYYAESATVALSTVANTPSALTFALTSGGAAFATHYVTDHAAPPNGGSGNENAYVGAPNLYLVLADSFGNTVPFSTLTGKTISVSTSSANGVFDCTGVCTSNGNKTTVTWANDGVVDDLNGGAVATDYYQSGTYGSIGVLSGIVMGTYPVTGKSISLSANSGNIVTAYFNTASAYVPTCSACGSTLPAVSTQAVKYATTQSGGEAQMGVPVIFYAKNTTVPFAFNNMPVVLGFWVGGTQPYDALTGKYNITGMTDITGKVSETWTIDSTFGSSVRFSVCIPEPTDASPNQVICSGGTSALTTTFNTAVNLFLNTYFDAPLTEPTTNAFNGAILYVDVFLVDAYGNVALNTFGAQIQIALHGSAGTLSATAPYIASLSSDTATFPSFGPVTWTVAGTAPTTITLSATGNIPGQSTASTSTVTLNIVTKTPSFTAAATSGNLVSGTVFSKTLAVSFGGTAAVSLGWDPALSVNFVSHSGGVYYKIDNGAWVLGTTSASSSFTWHVINVVFTAGAHTITFYANDSKSDMSATVQIPVVVDNTAPVITFTTHNNANLVAPAAVSGTIADSEGDLNVTGGVTAWAVQGTHTQALTVTLNAANNIGHAVTYGFNITGLTAGTWTVYLMASDLALNSATSAGLTVNVSVPLDQTFTSTTPTISTSSGIQVVTVTWTNNGLTSQNAQVWLVLKNTAGGEIYVTFNTITVASGANTGSMGFGVPVGIPSGSYIAETFVYVGGQAYSGISSVTVTVP